MKKITLIACSFSLGISLAFSALAASIYAPAIQVNEAVITEFEIQQRIKMIEAFGSRGDLRKQAVDQLINDRLRLQAAKETGISISEDDILNGMEEFAARGEFSAEQLLEYFNERNVYRETFADFIRAGILWREVIRSRFASKVNISDTEVDANLDIKSVSFPKTYNIAEIIIPISERGAERTRALADRLSQSIKNNSQFSTAARKFSKSSTAANGGSMGWIPVSTLPPQISSGLAGLEVGQMTAPLIQGAAIAIYQLRGIREAKAAGEQVISVSYLQVSMPNNKSGQSGQIAAASKLINSGNNCLDMQANTSKFSEGAVVSHALPASQVPARIGAEIARLDPNEASYFVAENGNVNIVMLCNRAKDLPDGAREQIRNALFGQRVGSFGDGYLQELRGDAIIIRK